LIDEDANPGAEPPPVNAEPMTRQFLRTFGTAIELKRDQLQKFLRGSVTTPDDFVQRGWCSEVKKVYTRTAPLDFARAWQGRHKRKLSADFDQALVLIGACVDGSGIHALDTLKNENLKPHVALKPLLEWLQTHGFSTLGKPAKLRRRNRLRCSMTMGSTGTETAARPWGHPGHKDMRVLSLN